MLSLEIMHYLFFKVHKKDISMIKHILEAYENMMIVSTVDDSLPKIQISTTPDLIKDCEAILEDLAKRFDMENLHEDPTRSQGLY